MRTTVELPDELWRAAQHRAIRDLVSLKAVVVEALEKHLGVEIPMPALVPVEEMRKDVERAKQMLRGGASCEWCGKRPGVPPLRLKKGMQKLLCDECANV